MYLSLLYYMIQVFYLYACLLHFLLQNEMLSYENEVFLYYKNMSFYVINLPLCFYILAKLVL